MMRKWPHQSMCPSKKLLHLKQCSYTYAKKLLYWNYILEDRQLWSQVPLLSLLPSLNTLLLFFITKSLLSSFPIPSLHNYLWSLSLMDAVPLPFIMQYTYNDQVVERSGLWWSLSLFLTFSSLCDCPPPLQFISNPDSLSWSLPISLKKKIYNIMNLFLNLKLLPRPYYSEKLLSNWNCLPGPCWTRSYLTRLFQPSSLAPRIKR